MTNNNNPLTIVVSVFSTLVAGGGLYLQWTDRNKVEDTAQVVTTNTNANYLTHKTLDKQVIVQTSKHQDINHKTDTQPKLATVSLKDDLPPLSLSIDTPQKEASSLNNLELSPPAKDFEDFDKAGF